MAYAWEKEVKEKYGPEVLAQLIAEQDAYVKEHKGNPCTRCGWPNEGVPSEVVEDSVMLIHYGLWSYPSGRCCECGETTYSKKERPTQWFHY